MDLIADRWRTVAVRAAILTTAEPVRVGVIVAVEIASAISGFPVVAIAVVALHSVEAVEAAEAADSVAAALEPAVAVVRPVWEPAVGAAGGGKERAIRRRL